MFKFHFKIKFFKDQYEYYQNLFKLNQISSFDEHKYEIDYLKKGQVYLNFIISYIK